jgi:hypothetical protein
VRQREYGEEQSRSVLRGGHIRTAGRRTDPVHLKTLREAETHERQCYVPID